MTNFDKFEPSSFAEKKSEVEEKLKEVGLINRRIESFRQAPYYRSDKDRREGERERKRQLREWCGKYEELTGFPSKNRERIANIHTEIGRLQNELEHTTGRIDFTRELYKNEKALKMVQKQRKLYLELQELGKEEEADFERSFGPDWQRRPEKP